MLYCGSFLPAELTFLVCIPRFPTLHYLTHTPVLCSHLLHTCLPHPTYSLVLPMPVLPVPSLDHWEEEGPHTIPLCPHTLHLLFPPSHSSTPTEPLFPGSGISSFPMPLTPPVPLPSFCHTLACPLPRVGQCCALPRDAFPSPSPSPPGDLTLPHCAFSPAHCPPPFLPSLPLPYLVHWWYFSCATLVCTAWQSVPAIALCWDTCTPLPACLCLIYPTTAFTPGVWTVVPLAHPLTLPRFLLPPCCAIVLQAGRFHSSQHAPSAFTFPFCWEEEHWLLIPLCEWTPPALPPLPTSHIHSPLTSLTGLGWPDRGNFRGKRRKRRKRRQGGGTQMHPCHLSLCTLHFLWVVGLLL